MSVVTVRMGGREAQGELRLPYSKSISNRMLIIQWLCPDRFTLNHLSEADDTVLMQELLEKISVTRSPHATILNAGNSGTVLRFLTALLAITPGSWLVMGDDRMHQRPVGILVEALRRLGAAVDYTQENGYPPLRISGRSLTGGEVEVDGSVSSQFVSALLMIGPTLPKGLFLRLAGEQVSRPYVEMTVRLMKEFGAGINYTRGGLTVTPGSYRFPGTGSASANPDDPRNPGWNVEADWSSAAFWFEVAALAEQAWIRLPGLNRDSLQGDAVVHEIYRHLGVETVWETNAVSLRRVQDDRPRSFGVRGKEQGYGPLAGKSSVDLSGFPDLAPALIVTCSALGIPARFSGLGHLKIKESNRLKVLEIGLRRLGRDVRHQESGLFEIKDKSPLEFGSPDQEPVTIDSHGDHRMAMAFAPLALRTGSITIAGAGVVSKSYPAFWADMKRVGFTVTEEG